MKALHVLTGAALITAACSDPVGKGWLVERTRVLAARTSAVADSGRASIAAGERAKVTWLVVGPRGAPRVSWSFAACARPEGNYPAPRCDGTVVASGRGLADGSGEVSMDLDVPVGLDRDVLVIASFC